MRDITFCHPRLQHLAGQLIEECGRQGLSIKIGETFRTGGAGRPVCPRQDETGEYSNQRPRQQLQLLSSVGDSI